MCSQKWARPGSSGGSEKAPTCTSSAAAQRLDLPSEMTVTRRPLGSVNALYSRSSRAFLVTAKASTGPVAVVAVVPTPPSTLPLTDTSALASLEDTPRAPPRTSDRTSHFFTLPCCCCCAETPFSDVSAATLSRFICTHRRLKLKLLLSWNESQLSTSTHSNAVSCINTIRSKASEVALGARVKERHSCLFGLPWLQSMKRRALE
mmetsp:Transcript_23490/g.52744  ORF Transcript_23490/g.52744 Transcript_23490/m.52744 type:complete len:205 (-) Transcript_23490:35-649(-)